VPDELFFGMPVREQHRLLGLPGTEPGSHPRAFGMGGSGGTFGYADPDTGIAFALTKNLQTMDFGTVEPIVELVADA
jgi:CubicO group peptidase (beta-lactamase class C family)